MKKVIISILTITLFLTACSSTVKESDTAGEYKKDMEITKVVTTSANRMIFSSFKQLLDSDWGVTAIVIGELLEETFGEFTYEYDEYFGKDIVVDTNAYNKLLVTEVFKGDIKPGDTITVTQRYAFDEEEGTLISSSHLTPMNKGDRWIYFLGYDKETDTYGPLGGRFPVPNKEIARNINERDYHRIKASDVGVFKLGDFDYHIYAQILKHFDIESRDWKNPGQAFDEKLITVVEQQAAEEARMKREAKIAD